MTRCIVFLSKEVAMVLPLRERGEGGGGGGGGICPKCPILDPPLASGVHLIQTSSMTDYRPTIDKL